MAQPFDNDQFAKNTVKGRALAEVQTRLASTEDAVGAAAASGGVASVLERGDYNTNSPLVTPLFPWGGTLVELPAPDTPPAAGRDYVTWSPNGQFLVMAGSAIDVYEMIGGKLFKVTTIATSVNGVKWSSDGRVLASCQGGTPFILAYGRAGVQFTKLADPAALPSGSGVTVAISPDSRFIAFGSGSAERVILYERRGALGDAPNLDTLFKLALPPQPTNDIVRMDWSPNGRLLAAVGSVSGVEFALYRRDGATLVRLTNPPGLGSNLIQGVAFAPTGDYMAAAQDGVDVHVWRVNHDGSSVVKIASPAAPAANLFHLQVAWSPEGDRLAVCYDRSGNADSAVRAVYIFKLDKDDETWTQESAFVTAAQGSYSYDVAWSPDQQFIAAAVGDGDFMVVQQTGLDRPAGAAVIPATKRQGT